MKKMKIEVIIANDHRESASIEDRGSRSGSPSYSRNVEKTDTTENNTILKALEIEQEPKLRKGWRAILKNLMAVKSVKFLW